MDADLKRLMGPRWYDLINTPEQLAYEHDNIRFKVCAAGRRSSKTERAKRRVISESFRVPGLYFFGAPTFNQVKKIYWADLKQFVPEYFRKGKPSETDLMMPLANGSEIHLVGFDKPQRFEGVPWTGGGIDEVADMKAEAIHANILPAFDTPGLETWCMFYGVPDGLNHFYDLAQFAKGGDKDWKFYHWKSADILSPEAIQSAKNRMPPKLYRQEYEASFETASGIIYEDYSAANTTDAVFIPGEIRWAHDFNFLPMSSAIIQTRGGNDYVVDEIILEHASPRQVAQEFVERYREHRSSKVVIYGDPSGRVGEKHGLLSNYLEIEAILRAAGFVVERRVFAATRSIRDGQNSLRARVLTADGQRHLFINEDKCPVTARGFQTVQLQKGSTYQEDETNNAQHVVSAIRYFSSYEYPTYGKGRVEVN